MTRTPSDIANESVIILSKYGLIEETMFLVQKTFNTTNNDLPVYQHFELLEHLHNAVKADIPDETRELYIDKAKNHLKQGIFSPLDHYNTEIEQIKDGLGNYEKRRRKYSSKKDAIKKASTRKSIDDLLSNIKNKIEAKKSSSASVTQPEFDNDVLFITDRLDEINKIQNEIIKTITLIEEEEHKGVVKRRWLIGISITVAFIIYKVATSK